MMVIGVRQRLRVSKKTWMLIKLTSLILISKELLLTNIKLESPFLK